MITDKDVEKLKKSFKATFATKDDLKELAKQKDLLEVKKDVSGLKTDVSGLKKDVKDLKKQVGDLTEYIVPTIGSILKWTDDIHAAIVGKRSSKTSEH